MSCNYPLKNKFIETSALLSIDYHAFSFEYYHHTESIFTSNPQIAYITNHGSNITPSHELVCVKLISIENNNPMKNKRKYRYE